MPVKFILVVTLLVFGACTLSKGKEAELPNAAAVAPVPEVTASPVDLIPNLQAEILDDRNKTTASPIGAFDFKNYTYPLPRGWENRDGKEITLVNGHVEPVSVSVNIDEKMTDEQKAEIKASRRIGMSFVTTKYLDLTNDGQDEAVVILKIETGGTAIPQVG